MIRTYTVYDFCKKYPCFKSTSFFRELLKDGHYIVKVDEVDGGFAGMEIGYPEDRWHLK